MDHNYCRSEPYNENAMRKRISVYCCVPQCYNYHIKGQGRSFHLFPKNSMVKLKWEVALKLGKPASRSMRVCSDHFVRRDFFPTGATIPRLFPHAVPSQNLPQKKNRNQRQKPQTEAKGLVGHLQEKRASAVQKINITKTQDFSKVHYLAQTIFNEVFSLHKSTQANLVDTRTVIFPSDERSLADFLCENKCEKAVQVSFIKIERRETPVLDYTDYILPHLISNGSYIGFLHETTQQKDEVKPSEKAQARVHIESVILE